MQKPVSNGLSHSVTRINLKLGGKFNHPPGSGPETGLSSGAEVGAAGNDAQAGDAEGKLVSARIAAVSGAVHCHGA